MVKPLRFGMTMIPIVALGFCCSSCGKGERKGGERLPIATESQQVSLKAYLEKWLPDPDKAAIFHGATSAEPGVPVSLSLHSRNELLRLLLRSLPTIVYSDKPFGETSAGQFSMPFNQAIVIGGARRHSPIVLVVAKSDHDDGERVIIQPVGIAELPGHFSTADPAVLSWFKQE